jgi:hypothetical protein
MKENTKKTEEISEHLLYEIWMLFTTAIFLNRNNDMFFHPDNSVEKNAFLESFVLHARALIDFLFTKPIKDDVSISDFLPENNLWQTKYKNIPDFLKEIQEPINKTAAHLTYYRIDKNKEWDASKISRELGMILKDFFDEVESKYLKEEFNNLYTRIDQELWSQKESLICTSQYIPLSSVPYMVIRGYNR